MLTAEPSLVMMTDPWKPPPHWLTVVYSTVQTGVDPEAVTTAATAMPVVARAVPRSRRNRLRRCGKRDSAEPECDQPYGSLPGSARSGAARSDTRSARGRLRAPTGGPSVG
ncbi:hypothetical protein GCM10018966_078890 [Streptomyces yanii]